MRAQDPPAPPHEAAPPAEARPVPDVEAPIRTCPNCGKRLIERMCKLSCPDPLCGYYLSCSDYY
jgi:hypothetical protein